MTDLLNGMPAAPPAGDREPPGDPARPGDDLPGARELLARLQEDALRFVDAVPYPPRAVRISTGAVSIEIEWQSLAAPATPPPGSVPAPAAAPAPPAAPAPEAPSGHEVRAPSVGVFYRAPEPGAAPFVQVGDVVRAGQQIGIVEVMKLMVAVEADRAGRVAEVLAEDGQPVEYDEAVLRLVPEGP